MEKKATKKKVKVELVNQKPEPIAEVYVFHNEWADRHGDSDTMVKVFSTKKKAEDHLKKDIKEYLEYHDAVKAVPTMTGVDKLMIDHKVIDEIDGKSLVRDRSLAAVLADAAKTGYIEINVDSSGTYSHWSIEKQDVM